MGASLVQTKVRWDIWFGLLLVLVVIIASFANFRSSVSTPFFRIAFWSVIIVFFLIIRKTRYLLGDDALVVSSLLGRTQVVPYFDVVRIVDTDRERIGKYNFSNKAIRVHFLKGSPCNIVISPVHKDLFLAALKARCPDAELETEL